ncbi:MAG: Cthe_2314 family HEPN domain-containing protein [Streptococcus salivarius]|nr:Cthe_2314 family HEPN domain-containing protein [Streptococcus salivarius]
MTIENNYENIYILEKIYEVEYNPSRFNIRYDETDKYILGFTTPIPRKETFVSKFIKCKTLYDTLVDLDFKIKISLKEALRYSSSKVLKETFNFFDSPSEDEKYAYYYIENALFRTASLWDILAQLYCIHYDVYINKSKVYYNQIFKPNNPINIKFKDDARKIYKYLKEKDNTNVSPEWKGNHRFVNRTRNKMIHRNSPNIISLSNFDVNIKTYPLTMLKRIVEDYNVVSKFILVIINEYEKDYVKNYLKTLFPTELDDIISLVTLSKNIL